MAIYDDLTRGHDRDTVLKTIDRLIPGWDLYDDPSGEMLALVLLDMHYALRRPGDYVYITPGYVWAIMFFTILEPTVAKVVQVKDTDELTEAEEAAGDERASCKPFEVRLTYDPAQFEDGAVPPEDSLPKELRDQILLVRVMTEEDAERLPAMLTVRTDGAPITLPSGRLPSHVG